METPTQSPTVRKRKLRPKIPGTAIRGVDELAKYLRVSKPTVYDWIANHGLPAAHIGSTFVTTTRLIDAWILKTCALTAELELGKIEDRILAATARNLADLACAFADDAERRAAHPPRTGRPRGRTPVRPNVTRAGIAAAANEREQRADRGPDGLPVDAGAAERFRQIRKRYERARGKLHPVTGTDLDDATRHITPRPVDPDDDERFGPVVAIPHDR